MVYQKKKRSGKQTTWVRPLITLVKSKVGRTRSEIVKKSFCVSMLTFSLETQTRRNAERKRETVRERRKMKKL